METGNFPLPSSAIPAPHFLKNGPAVNHCSENWPSLRQGMLTLKISTWNATRRHMLAYIYICICICITAHVLACMHTCVRACYIALLAGPLQRLLHEPVAGKRSGTRDRLFVRSRTMSRYHGSLKIGGVTTLKIQGRKSERESEQEREREREKKKKNKEIERERESPRPKSCFALFWEFTAHFCKS